MAIPFCWKTAGKTSGSAAGLAMQRNMMVTGDMVDLESRVKLIDFGVSRPDSLPCFCAHGFLPCLARLRSA